MDASAENSLQAGHVTVPLSEFSFTYVRSSGPGGQNVNKVNSKAVLRWPVVASASLPGDVKVRFMKRFANRISVEGDLVLTGDRYRDQGRNTEDCLEKVRLMLVEVATPPKRRRKTKPSKASIKRRLDGKRETSQRKSGRRAPRGED